MDPAFISSASLCQEGSSVLSHSLQEMNCGILGSIDGSFVTFPARGSQYLFLMVIIFTQCCLLLILTVFGR